jgi:hypothetical protein
MTTVKKYFNYLDMNKRRKIKKSEGMDSFHINKGRYKNPYLIGSDDYNSFERGFFQEHKRSP